MKEKLKKREECMRKRSEPFLALYVFWGPLVLGVMSTPEYYMGLTVTAGIVTYLICKVAPTRQESLFLLQFLQSDNGLTPIPYSYREIMKMTRDFRDRLGSGGFNTIYIGQIRTRYYVAVMMFREYGATDQDFVNDISTIGRIHHVNVVQLVYYHA